MRLRLVFLVNAILLIIQCLTAQTVKGPNKDSMLVAGKMNAFINDFNNLNWEGFHACFDETITVFLEDDTLTLMQGKPGVEQVFKSLFDNVREHVKGPPYLHIQPVNMVIQMLGNTALVTFHIVRTDFIARRTFVWNIKKEKWSIIHIHGSSVEKPKPGN